MYIWALTNNCRLYSFLNPGLSPEQSWNKHTAPPCSGPKSFIPDWMNIAAPAKSKTLTECKDKDLETQLRFCEKVN